MEIWNCFHIFIMAKLYVCDFLFLLYFTPLYLTSFVVFFQPQSENLFEVGMKLEAVNPENPNQICAATVTKVVSPLLWIHLDNHKKSVPSHIEHMHSHNIFPVGWCASNRFPLQPPKKVHKSVKTVDK